MNFVLHHESERTLSKVRRGPPALWPLVALTRDGTGEAMIHKALDAIEGRDFRTSAERADHLAVLWFVAEAEDVPVRVLRAYISEERLLRILAHRTGTVDRTVEERIRAVANVETLSAWYEQALLVVDLEGARRLVAQIQKAPLP